MPSSSLGSKTSRGFNIYWVYSNCHLYRFYLSFENAICRDYVTEKIFNALRLNTIPVVLGGADYSALLPPHSFIDARDHQGPEGGHCQTGILLLK